MKPLTQLTMRQVLHLPLFVGLFLIAVIQELALAIRSVLLHEWPDC